MLEVQKFLRKQSFDDLTSQLGIKVHRHATLPLAILNYDQIESPKTHPVVCECRGLVLHMKTMEVVARSFPRFFNWGEVAEEMDNFNFSDFTVQSKEDGSLVLLYQFEGSWRANTRGSFAEDNMPFQRFTWSDGICQALGVKTLDVLNPVLDPQFSYVCEFVSPWNRIVRKYDKPMLYLLTAFNRKTSKELTLTECDHFARAADMQRPTLYEFTGVDEIQVFLRKQEDDDPTYEGVVICDNDHRRWKIKNPAYLGLHRMKGEELNLYDPRRLLHFVLEGEEDELLTYFPEVRERFFELRGIVTEAYGQVLEAWIDHTNITDRKSFALAVGKRPFHGLLFQLRDRQDRGEPVTSAVVQKLWRDSGDLILRTLLQQ
ncbi:MAG: hypothetical protein MK102_05840 [Fuerstiella sp.]|nr:hypothetical protein [Fuerstiella sp.]